MFKWSANWSNLHPHKYSKSSERKNIQTLLGYGQQSFKDNIFLPSSLACKDNSYMDDDDARNYSLF